MNRVYQRRKEKLLERSQQRWGQPMFPNKRYYEMLRKELDDGKGI